MSYIVGAYSQIPQGSSNRIYEKALGTSLKPLLTEVYKRNKAFLQLYMTGNMIEWLDNNHKEVNMLIRDLVKCDKLEMLTGSYYQAILPLLPQSDRIAQIEKTTTMVSKHYKMLAKTFWCYGEIWDPSLINALNLCKIENVVITCTNSFKQENNLTQPFKMQEMGKCMDILPIDSSISKMIHDYSLGSLSFDLLLKGIKDINKDNKPHIVMLNLMQLCRGGIKFEEMSELLDVLFDDCLNGFDALYPKNKVLPLNYLDKGWYGYDSFLKEDESIQDALVKDEGLNYFYNRVLSFCETARLFKKDRDVKKRIQKTLPKLLCSAPFLYDANGSILRGSIRRSIWYYLIELEKVLSSISTFSFPYVLDYEKDGLDEVMSSGKILNAIIDSKGGSLLELKYYPALCNFADAIVPKGPFYKDSDKFIRGKKMKVFRDILLPKDYKTDNYRMKDNLATDKIFSIEALDKKYTEFGLLSDKIDGFGIKNTRHYKFYSNEIQLEITYENTTKENQEFIAGLEIPLTFFPYKELSFSIDDEKIELNEKKTFKEDVSVFKIRDNKNKARITFSSDLKYDLTAENVFINNISSSDVEKLYQFSFFVATYKLNLKPKEIYSLPVKLRIERN